MDRFRQRLQANAIPQLDPPPGFESNGLWFRDPDGLLVEIRVAEKSSPDQKSVVSNAIPAPGRAWRAQPLTRTSRQAAAPRARAVLHRRCRARHPVLSRHARAAAVRPLRRRDRFHARRPRQRPSHDRLRPVQRTGLHHSAGTSAPSTTSGLARCRWPTRDSRRLGPRPARARLQLLPLRARPVGKLVRVFVATSITFPPRQLDWASGGDHAPEGRVLHLGTERRRPGLRTFNYEQAGSDHGRRRRSVTSATDVVIVPAPVRSASRSPSNSATAASAASSSSATTASATARAPRPPTCARASICAAGASPTHCGRLADPARLPAERRLRHAHERPAARPVRECLQRPARAQRPLLRGGAMGPAIHARGGAARATPRPSPACASRSTPSCAASSRRRTASSATMREDLRPGRRGTRAQRLPGRRRRRAQHGARRDRRGHDGRRRGVCAISASSSARPISPRGTCTARPSCTGWSTQTCPPLLGPMDQHGLWFFMATKLAGQRRPGDASIRSS